MVPLLDEFLRRYPAIVPDWRFENRQVDLIGEGFDAGIGGGLDLKPATLAASINIRCATRLATLRRQTCVPALSSMTPEAICQAALMGLGVALLPMPFAVHWLQIGALVKSTARLIQSNGSSAALSAVRQH